MTFKTIDDLDVSGKRCLVRVDLNVPMADGKVADTTRIERIKPTIEELSNKGAKVILIAHFGRPKGEVNPELSLAPVVPALNEVFGMEISFADDSIGELAAGYVNEMQNGDVLLLENIRFYADEENNSAEFSKQLAELGDIYINDAFSAAHRAHASTHGIAKLLPSAAGRTMQSELEALNAALGTPKHPVVAVVGGAKVSTKLDLLMNLVSKVDTLVIGGGMANTFLAAQGVAVGNSLCEHDLAATARNVLEEAKRQNCHILLPTDCVVAKEFKANAQNAITSLDAIPADGMILDAGPKTVTEINAAFDESKTLIWNGPLGAFEIEPFDQATVATAQHAAKLTKSGDLISVAGGGDTVAAMKHAGIVDQLTYVSTAGGAFLEWMEGKELPGVAALG